MAAKSKARTLIVRMVSTAQTGYFYTTQRLRLGPRLAAVKYDPRAKCYDGINITNLEEQSHPASRSTRTVDHSTRFLIVSIANDVDDHVLRQSLARWVHKGVDHSRKHYRFLGYTDSQIKAGKLMFFREGDNWTVQRLLESFGDLPAVYLKSGYGKYAARLGLSFSSTIQSLDIPHECAIEIPDLLAPDGSLHSDGCGMIRDTFAAQVCKQHDLPPDTTVSQVRRGGIKGLLVRYPDDAFYRHCGKDPQAQSGLMIAYRPSMFKYEGGPTVLELNSYNSPPPVARLNLQFTALLLTLGVPLDVFKRLVQDQLDLIASILTDREKALGYIGGGLDAARDDGFLRDFYSMLSAGQELSEPYMRHLLRAFQWVQYNTLREKMSLRIRESAYLFGVVDEEGVLGPDEVYVNLPSRGGVLVRDVIVTRNPCYHPGDFRKLRAVDHPLLRHHRNCIVFSATAPHSVPDTIASGDLDGDRYFVCWDPSLLPRREAPPLNRAASAMSAPAPAGHKDRQLSDMPQAAVDTFMQIRNLSDSELLGTMSNEWTQQVELTPKLADSPYCRELVPLIETALDLVKSGEDFATLKEQFETLRSRHAQTSKKPNGSQSPIQKLRDMVPQPHKEKLEGLDGLQDEALILRDEDPTRWQHHISEAMEALPRFNREFFQAIRDDKEFAENFGSASEHSKDRHTPRRADRVKQLFQSLYFGGFGGGNEDMRREQRMRASAWYYYGYTKDKPGFAWLGERYLNEIKLALKERKTGTPEV
ncbi:RNA-dependent RNA polymerase [Ganoderma sinense ZZ0214-1]|uniref:RNA-dependent RNA polymerase n=1 Tax=Ganoderma sinense ZZ0214-1 TaxID=1077348 RepID=A0A2G8SRK7_9APHY|nr:RNA-dependent RNA polymerase [Ganoderma sinense ZZ0214-1]